MLRESRLAGNLVEAENEAVALRFAICCIADAAIKGATYKAL